MKQLCYIFILLLTLTACATTQNSPSIMPDGNYDLYFAFDEDLPDNKVQKTIKEVADQYRSEKDKIFFIRPYGRSGTISEQEHNELLTGRRAVFIREALVISGIEEKRIYSTARTDQEPPAGEVVELRIRSVK